MSKLFLGNTRGNALIITMVLVVLLASLCTLLVGEMSTRAKRVEIDLEDQKAFEAAEAGIDAALHDINSSPVYQPYMSSTSPNASRSSNGELNSTGGHATYSVVPLVGPTSLKALTVHVSKKADGTRPGCLGTSGSTSATNWIPAYDVDGNKRPTWLSRPTLNVGGQLKHCELGIRPLHTGHVAFFTYAEDWFHNRKDDDGDGVIDDRNERNKYTIYSTGIHRGLSQNGVTEAGRVVTLEVTAQAMDKDFEQLPRGALEIQIEPRL